MRRIKQDDLVQVLAGKDRGKRGHVRRVDWERARAVVQGVAMIKKHRRPSGVGQPAGIVEMEGTVHASNLALVCPDCARPTRVGFRIRTDGAKVRFCKRCSEDID